ncbi:aromatic amino acid ammonia-lyase [Sphaerisporangium corydalis]|uniref:Aromatic amino acid ammonia-lyase n=1 Tax=Sphaerisporangium corydalis TaxID=1441875 RepID=A0ABV9E7V7_9ACTN|nr:aromatic amino acid ammonia-lyase [Sphaerisporangium corydalis]
MVVRTITLDGTQARPADIVDIACAHAPVSLARAGLDRAADSQQAAIEIAKRRPVYGRSTGVGANRAEDVASSDTDTHGLRLLRSHAGGIGPLVPPAQVRAMLAVRANQILAGGGGLQPAFAEAMAAALNSGHLPEIHEIGAIGTGDLTALAETALTLIGERPWTTVHRPSDQPPGDHEAGDHEAGLEETAHLVTGHRPAGHLGTPPEPVKPAAGDALAFCSSSALTIGQATLAWSEIDGLLHVTHVVAALSLLAVDGSTEPYDEQVHAARPHPGSVAVAAEMRRLLSTPRTPEAQGPHIPEPAHTGLSPTPRIQDPFGYRCLPQVHGPAVDAASALERVLAIEINAAAENPLISLHTPSEDPPSATIHHHGGFHQAALGLAMDHLRVALLHTAHLSTARLATLAEPAFTGLRPFLAEGPAGSSGVMILEYSANSALAQLRNAAYPAGLGHAVLSRGMEDHASFASQSARQTFQAAASYRLVLACELVAAVRALRQRALTPDPATPAGQAFAQVSDHLDPRGEDRSLTPDVETATRLLNTLADPLTTPSQGPPRPARGRR